MKNNKKAQIETIGLVVIIILLVTIGFIFIAFTGKSKQEPIDQSTIALKQAITKTQTPYGEIKELISEAYQTKQTANLETELNKILQHFQTKTKQYSIEIQANNEKLLQINPCKGIVSSKIFTKNKIRYKFTLIKCNIL